MRHALQHLQPGVEEALKDLARGNHRDALYRARRLRKWLDEGIRDAEEALDAYRADVHAVERQTTIEGAGA